MNDSIVSAMVANPYVFFLKFVVEALPAAAFAYSLVWLVMRPKNGRHIPSPFLWHFYGIVAAVGGGAAFRTIALVTFAGRTAYEPESAAAGFYLMIVPAGVATAYLTVRLRALVSESDVTFKLPSWVMPISAWMGIVVLFATVTLPAYKNRTKEQTITELESYQRRPTTPNPFDQFDPDKNQLTSIAALTPFAGRADEPAQVTTLPQLKTNQLDDFPKNALMPEKKVQEPDWNNGVLTSPSEAKEIVEPQLGGNAAVVLQANAQTIDIQEHYRQIYAAHPDADALVESTSFKAWVAKYPTYQRFVNKGTAQEIIGMFTAYKNQR